MLLIAWLVWIPQVAKSVWKQSAVPPEDSVIACYVCSEEKLQECADPITFKSLLHLPLFICSKFHDTNYTPVPERMIMNSYHPRRMGPPINIMDDPTADPRTRVVNESPIESTTEIRRESTNTTTASTTSSTQLVEQTSPTTGATTASTTTPTTTTPTTTTPTTTTPTTTTPTTTTPTTTTPTTTTPTTTTPTTTTPTTTIRTTVRTSTTIRIQPGIEIGPGGQWRPINLAAVGKFDEQEPIPEYYNHPRNATFRKNEPKYYCFKVTEKVNGIPRVRRGCTTMFTTKQSACEAIKLNNITCYVCSGNLCNVAPSAIQASFLSIYFLPLLIKYN